jgi:hypothetical protein
MANTYTLLETITVGAAGASSVTFNSIPPTGYTDLVIKGSIRTSDSGTEGSLCIGFNGSTANFTLTMLRGSGAAASSFTRTTFSENRISYINAVGGTASTFANVEIYVPNYTAAVNKSISVDGVQEANATTAYSVLTAGLWSSTAAITSLNFTVGTAANFAQYSTFSLYGVAALGVTPTRAPKATGGSIIQTDGTYWYHAFLSSGSFTPATALSCDVLVVAGGGSGGYSNAGGGGGAGGVIAFASQSVSAAQTVTIGAGGAAASANPANSGSNSQFASLTAAVGGGYGGGGASTGANGGSGGGGYPGLSGGTGTSGQGYAGGAGGSFVSPYPSGGGGGAGAVGTAGSGSQSGAGGAGVNTVTNWGALSTALSTLGLGVSGYIAGGGGGGGTSQGSANGTGGSGGGGAGGTSAVAGTANTGSGGGGANAVNNGAAGGSGLVIIRYLAA